MNLVRWQKHDAIGVPPRPGCFPAAMQHVFYWSVAENKKRSQADSNIRESIGLNPNSPDGFHHCQLDRRTD